MPFVCFGAGRNEANGDETKETVRQVETERVQNGTEQNRTEQNRTEQTRREQRQSAKICSWQV